MVAEFSILYQYVPGVSEYCLCDHVLTSSMAGIDRNMPCKHGVDELITEKKKT